METLKFIHSFWAYLVLLIVITATLNNIVGVVTKKEFGAKDLKISLFGLIVTHIQLLLGIVLLIMVNDFSEMGMGEIMKKQCIAFKKRRTPVFNDYRYNFNNHRLLQT